MLGGMRGARGVRGAGGVHGAGGRAWCWGACVGYDEIRSMSGRYASYWNAFLFFKIIWNVKRELFMYIRSRNQINGIMFFWAL